MKTLLAVVLLLGTAAAAVESNRAERLMDTCDDCQMMVGRFVEASKNAEKRAAVQSTLNVVCGYLPRYSAECKVLVKNIERVVTKMQPFMLFAEKHRAKNTLKFIKKNICANVGRHQEMCNAAATELTPALFTDLHQLFSDSQEACASMALCKKTSTKTFQPSQTNLDAVLQNFWNAGPKTQQGDALECFTCEVEIDVILDELRKPTSTLNIANMIRDMACPILPDAYLLGCQDFLNLYAPTVVYMTVEQADSHTMCIKQGKCPNDTMTVQQKLQGLSEADRSSMLCNACQRSTKYARDAVIEPKFITEFVAGVQNFICHAYPGMYVEMCEKMVAKFTPKIVKMTTHHLNNPTFCTARGFC